MTFYVDLDEQFFLFTDRFGNLYGVYNRENYDLMAAHAHFTDKWSRNGHTVEIEIKN